MAENIWTNNPFTKAFGEMNAPFMAPIKEMAARYIDTSEKWANQALEMSEKTTEWAKDTPFAVMFETQRSLAKQMIGTSTSFARQLWKLDTQPATAEDASA